MLSSIICSHEDFLTLHSISFSTSSFIHVLDQEEQFSNIVLNKTTMHTVVEGVKVVDRHG